MAPGNTRAATCRLQHRIAERGWQNPLMSFQEGDAVGLSGSPEHMSKCILQGIMAELKT